MKLLRKSLPFLAASALCLAACGGTATSNDDAIAADSTDTADQISALTSATSDSVDPNMAGLSSETAAQIGSSGASAKLTAGCVTSTLVGNVVNYTLSSCSGPYGLVNVSGSLKATYTVNTVGPTTTLTVKLEGTALKVNGGSLDINSSAVITATGTARTATVSSATQATSARGNSITHSGMYTAGWDGSCVSLTGDFSTKSGLFSWMTDIANYKRCGASCPTSGKITFTGNFHTTTISFNGTKTAAITYDGRSGSLNLLCQ